MGGNNAELYLLIVLIIAFVNYMTWDGPKTKVIGAIEKNNFGMPWIILGLIVGAFSRTVLNFCIGIARFIYWIYPVFSAVIYQVYIICSDLILGLCTVFFALLPYLALVLCYALFIFFKDAEIEWSFIGFIISLLIPIGYGLRETIYKIFVFSGLPTKKDTKIICMYCGNSPNTLGFYGSNACPKINGNRSRKEYSCDFFEIKTSNNIFK
jgi:hypothetical protein